VISGLVAGAVPVPPLRSGQPPLAILVDYDGTIALTDVTDTLIARYLPAGIWTAEDEARYAAGALGSREIMEREVRDFPTDSRPLLETAAAQPHDPGFASFARRALAAGIPVEIVSDGFGFFIGPAMARLGVPDIPVITAETTFQNGQARIEFPNGNPDCYVCGTCKRNRVLAHQAAGRAVAFIGDGVSDLYAAGYADLVFAKQSLVRICETNGWPYRPWHDFAELESWLAGAIEAWSADRETPRPAVHPFFCGPEVWGPGRTAPARRRELP
jgi:2-hydroxy-3-keto-5-methylthiopentenyl-1-phosphate phosphatase